MSTSKDFMALAVLSAIALDGRSALLREFQSELCRSVSKQRRVMSLVSVRMLLQLWYDVMSYTPDVNDSFYEAPATTVTLTNIDEPLFILGDFNARVENQRIH